MPGFFVAHLQKEWLDMRELKRCDTLARDLINDFLHPSFPTNVICTAQIGQCFLLMRAICHA